MLPARVAEAFATTPSKPLLSTQPLAARPASQASPAAAPSTENPEGPLLLRSHSQHSQHSQPNAAVLPESTRDQRGVLRNADAEREVRVFSHGARGLGVIKVDVLLRAALCTGCSPSGSSCAASCSPRGGPAAQLTFRRGQCSRRAGHSLEVGARQSRLVGEHRRPLQGGESAGAWREKSIPGWPASEQRDHATPSRRRAWTSTSEGEDGCATLLNRDDPAARAVPSAVGGDFVFVSACPLTPSSLGRAGGHSPRRAWPLCCMQTDRQHRRPPYGPSPLPRVPRGRDLQQIRQPSTQARALVHHTCLSTCYRR